MAKAKKPAPPLDPSPIEIEPDPTNPNYGTIKILPATAPAKLTGFTFQNARSYHAASANLDPGLNVIIGESDCGKTNVLRNIRALVKNAGLESIRTSGAPEKTIASVVLVTSDGGTFGLDRSESKNACTAEFPIQRSIGRDNDIIETDDPRTKSWTSVGNGMPDEFKKLLALSPIDLSGVEADVHFSDQREPLFVVDDPPSKIAKMVGAVSGLDVLYRAVAAGDKEKRDTAAAAKAASAIHDRAKAAAAEAGNLADRLAPHFLAFTQAEMGLEIAHRTRTTLGNHRTNYTTGREKTRRIFDASQALTKATTAAREALGSANATVDRRQVYAAAAWAKFQADHAHQRAAPTLAAAQAQLAAAEALEPAAAALAAATARRTAYLTAHQRFTKAQETNHNAQQALDTATTARDATYQALGPTAIPCPTCGTTVTAASLANR